MIKIKPWAEDRWDSLISDPFTHPDKAGHLIAHLVLTAGFAWGISLAGGPLALAWIFDLWINTQIEVMDGTRPRRKLYPARWPVMYLSQGDYERDTVDGFSVKDWLAGIAGSTVTVGAGLLLGWG